MVLTQVMGWAEILNVAQKPLHKPYQVEQGGKQTLKEWFHTTLLMLGYEPHKEEHKGRGLCSFPGQFVIDFGANASGEQCEVGLLGCSSFLLLKT